MWESEARGEWTVECGAVRGQAGDARVLVYIRHAVTH